MSVAYQPVIWNRQKIFYDVILLLAVVLYIYLFLRVAPQYQDISRPLDGAVLRMRAFGSCAFLMLTVILCIGPMARIDKRFVALLYNRRHFGVMTATIATVHASYVLSWYFAFSPTGDYEALLSSNRDFGQLLGFPFEVLGIFGLIILLVLATTSHDFWLKFLSPPVWKTLHMGIYFAYASVVLHVALGALQSNPNPILTPLVCVSVVLVSGLHFYTALLASRDKGTDETGDWIAAGSVNEIANNRAKVVTFNNGEKAAIFRYDGKLSAVTNVCAHQNGPLGEGRVMRCVITCPWHGYQYNLHNGRSPAPFTEKIATYKLKMEDDLIFIDPNPLPAGTHVDPIEFVEPKVEGAA